MQPQSVSEPNKGSKETREGMKLKELPAGYMGKILVYRSGKVKMKIGDILFDVSFKTGSICVFCIGFACSTQITINKLCRFLLAQIASLSRKLQQLTPEKSIAARWGRSASALLSPPILDVCWVLLTRWKSSSFISFAITMAISRMPHRKGVLFLQDNNLRVYHPEFRSRRKESQEITILMLNKKKLKKQ
jgi:hypothetical protein